MTQPESADPDSTEQIARSLRGSGEGSRIGRLIGQLGAKPPAVDLQQDDTSDMRSQPNDVPGQANLTVLGEIARGGMGVVLRGHEQDLRRDVAIKVLQRRHAGRPEVIARFVEEAQIGGQLQHPGVVPVYELGVLEDQRPYFTMKLIKGETLEARLRRHDARQRDAGETRQLLDIYLSVCMTMAYAHDRGVIHRDLKPANVMVGAFGEVQVVDWGLAKVLPRDEDAPRRSSRPSTAAVSIVETLRTEPGSAGASVAGSVLGTPAYMPPEQARGEIDDLDERSDVFALGAMLCEVLTGLPPYGPDFRTALLQAARGDLAEATKRLEDSGADPALITLCRECLAPAAAARPRNAGVVAKAVQEYQAAADRRAHEAQLAAATATARAEAAHRTRNLTIALAAVVLLAVVGGGAGYAWVRSSAAQRLEAGLERVRTAAAEAERLKGGQQWVEAAAAARRAVDLLPDDAPSSFAANVRAEHAALDQRVLAERQAADLAADNARLLRELGDIAEPDGGRYQPTDWHRVDAQFAAAFAAHGLDPESPDPERQQALLARGIGEPLAQSLVEWAAVRRTRKDNDGSGRLLRAALRIDPDPLRIALRTAVLGDNAAAVEAIASGPDMQVAASATLVDLVRALRAVGRAGTALDVQLAACLRHPDDALLANEVAGDLTKAGRGAEAVRLLHGALAASPDSLPTRRSLVCAYELTLGELETAEVLGRESLRRFPNDAYLHLRLGMCLLAQERIDPKGLPIHRQPATPRQTEAIAELRRAIELGPHPDYHQVLGNALNGLGHFEEAAAVVRDGLSLAAATACDDETRVHLLHTLCASLDRLGRRDEALTAAREAVRIGPDSEPAVHSLVVCLSGADPAAAEATARAFLARRPESMLVRVSLARVLSAQGRRADALQALETATQMAPGETMAWVELVVWHFMAKDIAAAMTACEKALALHPEVWELVDLQCELLRASGRLDELRTRMEALRQRRPDHPVSWAQLGRLAGDGGDHKKAVEMLRRASELGFNTPGHAYNLAREVHAAEGPAAALRIFDSAVASWPDLASMEAGRARMLAELGRDDEALAASEAAVQKAPGRAFVHEVLARHLLRVGKLTAAAAAARRAMQPSTGPEQEVEPNPDSDFAFEVGTALIEAAPDLAVQLLRVAVAQQPDVAECWCNLGHALGASGRHAEALAAMQKGDELGRKRADWQYPSAEWVERTEFMAAAEERWTRWLGEGGAPPSAEERLGMAKWALARGEAEPALRLFEPLVAGDGPCAMAASGCHLDSAIAAVLVAAKRTEPAARLDLLRWARLQLSHHLTAMQAVVAAEPVAREPVAAHLQFAVDEERLGALRDEAALQALPADDAAACRRIFDDYRAAIAAMSRS